MNRKKLDITNHKFGRLIAKKDVGRNKKGEVLWQCDCSCSGKKIVTGSHLRKGYVQSCGCLQREYYDSSKKNMRIDLTNKKFGKLTFIKDVGKNKWGHRVWLCKCDCGNETTVTSSNYRKAQACSLNCYDRPKGRNSKIWKGGVIENNLALYDTYADRLEFAEEVKNNADLLEVKCAYCGRWISPSRSEVKNRLRFLSGKGTAECRFYCSENCKIACPIFRTQKWPKGFKKATSREVQPELRQMVLKRDNYTCQHGDCGKTIDDAELHCHHITGVVQNPIESADIDNCITFCKEHHKEIHKNKGCGYNDLKCH